MTNETKRRAVLFLTLAAVITVLLAVALPRLELQKGIPLPGKNGPVQVQPLEPVEPAATVNSRTFLDLIVGIFLLTVLIYLLIRARRKRTWKEYARVLMWLALLALNVAIMLLSTANVEIVMKPKAKEILPEEVAIIAGGPPLAPLPGYLLWLVWIGLIGLALLLVILFARARIRPNAGSDAGQDALAVEAEKAVEAIQAGEVFSNVILRCYQQMSRVLQTEQGLALEQAMTAREFEALLEKRGVPNPPVHKLTQLFEIARYAAQPPGPLEEAQAVECLTAIAQYSSRKKMDRPG